MLEKNVAMLFFFKITYKTVIVHIVGMLIFFVIPMK